MCQELKPRKHAELIKKWADGAQIQFRHCNDPKDEWMDIGNPNWKVEFEYRIKPKEPIVRYATTTYWKKSKEAGDNIKATFCPDTGKLLSVEMIED